MAVEIERKFLVLEGWRDQIESSHFMAQGYLGGDRCSVRVRINGDQATLNIKSRELGASRLEYEYEIPLAEGHEILERVSNGPVVEKTRHLIRFQGHLWEVDEFHADNQGLVVAEIELDHEDEAFGRPDWLGPEVTDDPRYYNLNLAVHPFRSWKES
ncbi:MAG: CYTH domain-containing protein [Xanthomonadales bacterium]|nr:CYTH domain-containing protein [Xanthomonadales bacterium]